MMNNNYEDTNDSELIMLYGENDEDAKNIIFYKYKFIIDILIKKYTRAINTLNIDLQEVYSECTVGFSDALKSFQEEKDTTLPTFITLCVERRLNNLVKRYNQEKYKIINDTYSLDYFYEQFGRPLIEILVDNKKEPLDNMMECEEYDELLQNIKRVLTRKEYNVFHYLVSGFNYQQIAKITNESPKHIDNTIQRIKIKVKKLIKETV